MFGLRLAIGAADNTTGVLRGIESRLKNFSSRVMTFLNLGGLVMVFSRVGRAIDRAFNAGAYAKEWGEFKDRVGSAWTDTITRITDAWASMFGSAEKLAMRVVGVVDKIIDGLQQAGAFLGAIFSGAGVGEALETAKKTVEQLKKEREERRKVNQEAGAIPAAGRESPAERMEAFRRQAAERGQHRLGESPSQRVGDLQSRDAVERRRMGPSGYAGSSRFRRPAWINQRKDYTAAAINAADDKELRDLATGPMSAIVAAERAQKKDKRRDDKFRRLQSAAADHVARRGRMGISEERAIAELPKRMRIAMEAKKREEGAVNYQEQIYKSLHNIESEVVGSTTGGA